MVHFLFLHPISIHALLAESDRDRRIFMPKLRYFYPRSPCGERLFARELLLRYQDISIHALLAESDTTPICAGLQDGQFLSTLSLRRATFGGQIVGHGQDISIHALLAESDPLADGAQPGATISIHALLAESDPIWGAAPAPATHFYPRSPCGERRQAHSQARRGYCISIHALLAESDNFLFNLGQSMPVFLSTLSLRRATMHTALFRASITHFYPRSPCGERPPSIFRH